MTTGNAQNPLQRTNDPDSYLEQRRLRIEAHRKELEQRYPPETRLVFEAGCGHGHFLTAYAESHPESPCMGVDLVSRRIRKAIDKKDKRQLEHLHFMKAAVNEWIEALPSERYFERIFMLFPDPWPKKRHRKHRMLQPKLLSQFAARCVPDARLHFRSDHEENFAWAVEQVEQHPAWQIAPAEPWPFEHSSFFQEFMDRYQSFTAVLNSSPTK